MRRIYECNSGNVVVAISLVPLVVAICVSRATGEEASSPAATSSPRASTAGALAEITDCNYDFGSHLHYKPVSHTFRIKNAGDEPLAVKITKRSCGCVGGVLTEDRVPPGGTAEVAVGYTPQKEKPRLGPQSFTVEVTTNDPRREKIALGIKGTLVRPVYAEPAALDFGIPQESMNLKKLLTVGCIRDTTLPHVLSVEPMSPEVQVRELSYKTSEETSERTYEVSLTLTNTSGDFRSVITVKSDSRELPLLEVPVKAFSRMPVSATPPRVLLGLVEQGSKAERCVELHCDDATLTPRQVRAGDARVTAVLESSAEKGTWRLRVALTADSATTRPETLKTELDILDQDGVKIAGVPVFAVITPAKGGVANANH